MNEQYLIAAYGGGLIILFIFIKLFYTPIKVALKLILSSVFGGIILVVLNYVGGVAGLEIGVNVITCAIAGILGVPGISLMLMLQIATL